MKKQRGIEEALSGTVLRGGEAISNKLAYAFGKAAGLGPKVLARGAAWISVRGRSFKIQKTFASFRVSELGEFSNFRI